MISDKELADLGLRRVQKELAVGDLYVAKRNTGPHLLTVREIRDGYVVPEEQAYSYELWECVPVEGMP